MPASGTPRYMAPESILDPDSVDVRTDIYALGAVAYYLLAGGELFAGKTLVEVCSQHIHQQPEPLSKRGITVDPGLEALVRACLEKEPSLRSQSAAELRRRLEACVVESWDSAAARTWWTAHQSAIDADAVSGADESRTILVDGSRDLSVGLRRAARRYAPDERAQTSTGTDAEAASDVQV